MKKSLLFAIPLSIMVAFSACKKEEEPTDDKNGGGDEPQAELVVKKEQRGFVGYVGATWCPPCGAYGGPAFKELKGSYTNKEIVPVYFAPSGETVPYSTDGSKIVTAQFANDFYAQLKSAGSIPFFNVNGNNEGGATTSASGTATKFKGILDDFRGFEAKIGVAARAKIDGNKITCDVKVESYKDLPANLYYSVLVLENSVKGLQKISGKPDNNQYEHTNLVRASLVGDGSMKGQKAFEIVSSSAITTGQEFSKSFTLNYEDLDIAGARLIKWNLDPANTTVVAMVWRKIGNEYTFVNGIIAE